MSSAPPHIPSPVLSSGVLAGSIVRLFMENGIAPDRLVAVGRGETKPTADNDTPEGRAQNRRVAITIISNTANGQDAAPAGVAVKIPQ